MVNPYILLHFLKPTPGWIIWMDADTLFTNFDTRWETFLVGDVVYSDSPDVVSNNGVFALRTGFASRSFMMDWIERSAGLRAEQDNVSFILSLLHFILLIQGDAQSESVCDDHRDYNALAQCFVRALRAARASATLEVRDALFTAVKGINSGLTFTEPNKYRPGDFVMHFAGWSPDAREEAALKFVRMFSELT